MNPYTTLGLQGNASADEIKKAYRDLAKKYHPDKNQGDKEAEERFKEISQANEILSDPKKKEYYDNFGDAPPRQSNRSDSFGQFNIRDFMNSQFNSFFENSSATQQPQRPQKRRIQKDITITARIGLKHAIFGGKMNLKIQRATECEVCEGVGCTQEENECPECNGKGGTTHIQRDPNSLSSIQFMSQCEKCQGFGRITTQCPTCNGKGYVEKTESILVKIPVKVSQMTKLKVGGKGHTITLNGKASTGDLYIMVTYHPEDNGVAINQGKLYTTIYVPLDLLIDNETIDVIIFDTTLKLDLGQNSNNSVYETEIALNKDTMPAIIQVIPQLPSKEIDAETRKSIAELLRKSCGKSDTTIHPINS